MLSSDLGVVSGTPLRGMGKSAEVQEKKRDRGAPLRVKSAEDVENREVGGQKRKRG